MKKFEAEFTIKETMTKEFSKLFAEGYTLVLAATSTHSQEIYYFKKTSSKEEEYAFIASETPGLYLVECSFYKGTIAQSTSFIKELKETATEIETFAHYFIEEVLTESCESEYIKAKTEKELAKKTKSYHHLR